VPLVALAAVSRVTVFPLEGLSVAYTTHSSDARGLGDVGVVAVLHDELSEGEELWRLASQLGGRNASQEQARWILTQAGRARVVGAGDLLGVAWEAVVRRRHELGGLFMNHEVLMTGRMRVAGWSAGVSPSVLGAPS